MDIPEFFRAVDSGNLSLIELALEDRLDLDALDERGRRLLGLAVTRSRPEVVEMLLAAGADPNAPDAQGRSAVMLHLSFIGDLENRAAQRAIADALRRAGGRFDAEPHIELWRAAVDGAHRRVDALLREGADPDAPGVHVLADAAQAGHVAVVERLLDAGAAIERPRGTRTPLLVAAHAGQREVVMRLLARGARPLPEGADENAGYAAIRGEHFGLAQWLEQQTGLAARRRFAARVEPGDHPAGWAEFARTVPPAGAGWYGLIGVHAPIEQVSPAARDEEDAERLLVGIDTDPQWLLIWERPRIVVQVRGCPWTLIAYLNVHKRIGGDAVPVAEGLAYRHGWRVLLHVEDKFSEGFEVSLLERDRTTRRFRDPSIFSSEGVVLPGFDIHAEHGVTLSGIGPDALVRVDAFTRQRVGPWSRRR